MSNPPVVVSIQDHYGNSGDFRLVIREFFSQDRDTFTRDIVGYYKTQEGVVDRAVEKSVKYAEGKHIIPSDQDKARPVSIGLPNNDQRTEVRELVEFKLDDEEMYRLKVMKRD